MKLPFLRLARLTCLAGILAAGGALACGPEQDGCLGCNDDQLPVCLNSFVKEICKASGNPANCDSRRAYDDAERYVLISTGSHMARVTSLLRSARKYQMH